MFLSLRGKKNTVERDLRNAKGTNVSHINNLSLTQGSLIVDSKSQLPLAVNTGEIVHDRNRPKIGAVDANDRDIKTDQLMELTYHEPRVSNNIVVFQDEIPHIREGDIVELKTMKGRGYKNALHTSANAYLKMCIKVEYSADGLKRKHKPQNVKSLPQISCQQSELQPILQVPSRSKILIRHGDSIKYKYRADLVELIIKDCMVNRGDMWLLSSKLTKQCVFLGQKIDYMDTIRANIYGIFKDGRKKLSGYIDDSTRIVFRSESARLVFIVQITEEMWSFEDNGEQLFQTMVNSLFPKIFRKWKAKGTHHSITIAFVIPMNYSDIICNDLKPGEALPSKTDFLRVVVDQVSIIHWIDIIETLKIEFMAINKDLLNFSRNKDSTSIRGQFVPVIKSNILEAINIATSILANPFSKPDLRHSGTHLIIISPSSGIFDVDYDLLQTTEIKLRSMEMTMDLLCLSRPPLHVVPLFRTIDHSNKLHYCVLPWLPTFFWNESKTTVYEHWKSRCKIYSLQMMGMTDKEVVRETKIDNLKLTEPGEIKTFEQFMEKYDSEVFRINEKEFLDDHEDIINYPSNFNHYNSGQNVMNTIGPLALKKQEHTREIVNSNNNCAPKSLANTLHKSTIKNELLIQKPTTSVSSCSSMGQFRNYRTENTETNLALDSLRGVNRKCSTRGIGQKFLSKFTSTTGLPFDEEWRFLKVVKDDASNKSHPVPRDGKLQFSDNTFIIKKNLAIFDKLDNGSKSLSPELESVVDSPFLKPSPKPKSSKTEKYIGNDDLGSSVGTDSKGQNYHFSDNYAWIELDTPSIPFDSCLGQLLPVRWAHVWPPKVPKKYSKWRSFTSPAELPITRPDFPHKYDFETNYSFRTHSVAMSPEQEQFGFDFKFLLMDMVYLRLVTGFQLCVNDEIIRIEQGRSRKDSKTGIQRYLSKDFTNSVFYMMIDNEIHRISLGSEFIIEVERYVKKNDKIGRIQISSYTPYVKTRYESTYREAKIDPINVARKSLNWNQLDQSLAGYNEYFADRQWQGFRAKYVVLPTDTFSSTFSIVVNGRHEPLTQEEIRVEGLRRLIASIARARLLTLKEREDLVQSKERVQPEIIFYTGSLFDLINEQQDSLEKSTVNYKDTLFSYKKQLSKHIDLTTLAKELQCGSERLQLVNRRWHWKKYSNCFTGVEMVNWLLKNILEIDTREEAVEYGQRLMKQGMFVHVLDKHNFLDGYYFYQIARDYIHDLSIAENTDIGMELKGKKSKTSMLDNKPGVVPLSKSQSSTKEGSQRLSANENDKTKPSVILSNSLVIDLDSKKKYSKREVCTVHYDRVHNPDHCFHIRLEWFTATPKLIDDQISNWSRICERFGLKLIEVPWEELCTIPSVSPFHSFLEVKLAINPWVDTDFKVSDILSKNKFYYHAFLLHETGFLLDNRASRFFQNSDMNFDIIYSWGKPQFKFAQYIHGSGLYIAEMRDNGDFFLAPNNEYISRVNPGSVVSNTAKMQSYSDKPAFQDSFQVIQEFKDLCEDAHSLKALFLRAKDKWAEGKFFEN